MHNEIEQTTTDLTRLMEQIKQIQTGVDGFVAMEDVFKGKAANSIRAFYQEGHMPLLVFMEGFITNFQDALEKVKHSLTSLEPDEQGYIHEGFLQEDVKKGLKNAENVTMGLTDEANRVISTVSDILPLPSLDDSDFLEQAQRARKKVDLTLEKLHAFDSESTRLLIRPQNDLDMMQTYVNELGGMVSRGEISIGNYAVQQLSQYDFHQALISGVRGKAVNNMLSLDVLIGLGATNLLSRFVPHDGGWMNMLAEKFEMKTAEYSLRALNVVAASVGSTISEREFATVKGQVVNTKKVSDYQGEWYGNYLTLMDGRILREHMDPVGNVNYQFVSVIPENRLNPKTMAKNKEESGFMDGLKRAGMRTGYVAKATADFLVLDDIKTLGDSDSSTVDKVISGASLIPVGKVLKLTKIDGVFKVNKKGEMPAKKADNTKLSPSNYPNPDPPMSLPPVKYQPKTINEVTRMRNGKGPTTKMKHGDKNIEAHHRQQIPVKKGGKLDELEQRIHRRGGNHTRHKKPSQLTPSQRAKEIREHYKERGKEYILPGEGI